MPGRLSIYKDKAFKDDAIELIKNDMIGELNPRYNIPPTTPIPALLNNGNYLYAHFGYLPSWASSKTSMNINARSESIYEKKTFRESFKYRRCIIPINGFYEWEKDDKEKIPYLVSDLKNNYLALAGIWDEYFDEQLNMKIVTIALITCDANEKLGEIHHRMPIVLEKKDFTTWLKSEDIKEVNSLFKIYPNEKIDIYEVTNEVNKVLFDEVICIKKVEEKKVKEGLKEVGQLTLF
ncbi:SOS response-associated peptidase [Poseidonibacter lekithochrous]|uniref:SOS response-associated peptidase n=1 Tax=Poseidonibacter TaxID=2321187 RepID=UPI001C0A27A3|nr:MULTISPECIES: SOS response-associated peptidase [Poseidonibacter]MBU3013963.1 SOS response-associated peptidase [Poseidonibacter lekithochrous]MDO6827258.1 SOS response-associated peptidase [Poseidonibacter sp. 1_MG-2023]